MLMKNLIQNNTSNCISIASIKDMKDQNVVITIAYGGKMYAEVCRLLKPVLMC